jgi:hypothetical protein
MRANWPFPPTHKTANKKPPSEKTAAITAQTAFLLGTALESVAVVLSLFGLAAFRAALGFVEQTLFLIKFLFAFGEHEFFRAIFANQCLIRHGFLLCVWDFGIRGGDTPKNKGIGSLNV